MLRMARRCAVMAGLSLALVLSACDDQPDVEQLLADAAKHLEAGDLNASIIELKNAVQAEPDNAEARRMLGEAYQMAGDLAGAEKELMRAVELGDTSEELELAILQLQVRQEKYEEVVAATEGLGKPETTIGVRQLALRGAALFGLGRLDEAKTTFAAAHGIEPVQESYMGHARVALYERKLDVAGRYLQEGLERFPDDPDLVQIYGETLLAEEKVEEAERTFTRLVELEPNRLSAHLGLARARIGLGQFDEARKSLDELDRQTGGSVSVKALRTVVALRAKDYQVAQQDARDVLASQPDNLGALFAAGTSSYALGQYEQARSALTRYLASVPGDSAARKLLGATELRLGQNEQAFDTLNSGIEEGTPDSSYLAVTSMASILRGDVEGGLSYLERAVVQSPEDAQLRARLGLTKIALGATGDGTSDLERALELDPELEDSPVIDKVLRGLIIGYLQQKRFDEALEAAKRLQEKEPEATAGYVLAGTAYLGKNDEAAARQSFEKAQEIEPGATDAGTNLAMLELRQGRPEEALRRLRTVVEHHPQHYRTLMILAELEGALGRTEPQKDWLRKAVEASPDRWEPRIQLAEKLLLENRPQEALAVGRPALDAHDGVPAVLNIVGTAQLANGRVDEAAETFRKWTTVEPDRGEPQFRLAEALTRLGNTEGAIEAMARSAELDPGNAGAKLALADLLLSAGQLERAREVAAQLNAQVPGHPATKVVEGRILLQENKPEEAVAAFKEAKQGLDVSRVNTGLATAQWMAGEQDAAVATLQEWLARSPDDLPARIALNTYLVSLDRTEEARKNLEGALERNASNPFALTELAWINWKEGKLDEALPLAERAYGVAPENPRVLDTLGMIELDRGQAERAASLLARAAELNRDDLQTRYHWALALSKAGRKNEAIAVLEKAIGEERPFPEREQAEQLLKELRGS